MAPDGKSQRAWCLYSSSVVIILPVKPVSGGQAEHKTYAAALATGGCYRGVPGLWLLGAGANAVMQYADSGEINSVNSSGSRLDKMR